MDLRGVLEGLLFVVGDDGLTMEAIKKLMNISDKQVKELILSLQDSYRSNQRGIKIEVLGSSFKLVTKKEHHLFYQKLFDDEQGNSLSQAGLETLAIVAYNEPITRMQIDEIRGVNSSYVLRKLSVIGLIASKGRSSLPGKPIVYGVTKQFLDYFGLQTMADLPKLDPIKVDDLKEHDLFNSERI
ncbi:MAG: SMC-Scp complex subunit ScpB [Bacilli bacterium]